MGEEYGARHKVQGRGRNVELLVVGCELGADVG